LLEEAYKDLMRHTGPALSPFNAWLLLKGLETLDLRVRAQSHAAASLADLLAAHPKVRACRYPTRSDHPQHAIGARQMTGGGTLVAFDLG
jgi:O-succinylhomoserine sulfhydrylase